MTDIGTMVYDLFQPLGIYGGLVCIFILFYVDAILFPTVPELFTVIIFTTVPLNPGPSLLMYAGGVLATIVVAEITGVITLYMIVKRAKVPERICEVIRRYQAFLFCRDERMILVNRIAPVVPFLGAFIAVTRWSLKKSLAFVVIGGVLKYGIILALSGLFVVYFSQGTARIATVVMVLLIILLSVIVSYYRKRKSQDACGTS